MPRTPAVVNCFQCHGEIWQRDTVDPSKWCTMCGGQGTIPALYRVHIDQYGITVSCRAWHRHDVHSVTTRDWHYVLDLPVAAQYRVTWEANARFMPPSC